MVEVGGGGIKVPKTELPPTFTAGGLSTWTLHSGHTHAHPIHSFSVRKTCRSPRCLEENKMWSKSPEQRRRGVAAKGTVTLILCAGVCPAHLPPGRLLPDAGIQGAPSDLISLRAIPRLTHLPLSLLPLVPHLSPLQPMSRALPWGWGYLPGSDSPLRVVSLSLLPIWLPCIFILFLLSLPLPPSPNPLPSIPDFP